MKRKNGAVDQENLKLKQTKAWTRHEIQYRAQFCLLGDSERKKQKPKFDRQSFVVAPAGDDRERCPLSQG